MANDRETFAPPLHGGRQGFFESPELHSKNASGKVLLALG
jgi:hypothetical protein